MFPVLIPFNALSLAQIIVSIECNDFSILYDIKVKAQSYDFF